MPLQSPYNPNYFEDNLDKHECLDCGKAFIVGTDLSKDVNIHCPYCQSANTECVAWIDDEGLSELDLGCLAIPYTTEDK